jgi:hypothetical protein
MMVIIKLRAMLRVKDDQGGQCQLLPRDLIREFYYSSQSDMLITVKIHIHILKRRDPVLFPQFHDFQCQVQNGRPNVLPVLLSKSIRDQDYQ